MYAIDSISGTSQELLAQLERQEWYAEACQRMGEGRLREWLAVRVLLKKSLGEEKKIDYTASGKPYLTDGSYHIGISHTKGFVAVAWDKNHPVSIDIERIAKRVENVEDRFLNEAEKNQLSSEHRLIHVLLHWSAKETLFKYMDENDIDFKTQLHIHPFEPLINQQSTMNAFETRTVSMQTFSICYWVTDECVLTWIE